MTKRRHASVIQRCRERFRGHCVAIYDGDRKTVVRYAECRQWCPLLKEVIR